VALNVSLKFAEWREHPGLMVRELFGVKPDPWQDKVLEEFPHNQRIALLASKGVGKTTLLAWIGWNFLLTRTNPRCAATSISGDTLRDTFWAEMAKWRSGCPLLEEMFGFTSQKIFYKAKPDTWWMAARTWPQNGDTSQQANTLAGIHEDYVLFLIDESGGMTDAIMGAAEAALSSCIEGHVVQAGNPTHRSGPLYKAFENEHGLWHLVMVNGDPDNPLRAPRISVRWARDTILQWGVNHPYVRVNVFGEFPPANFNSLIGPEEIRDAQKRYYRDFQIGIEPRVLGVDIARYGDDSSVISPRQGIQAFPFESYRNLNGVEGASIVNRKRIDWRADAIFMDDTGGFGSSWIDHSRL
jgi:phage terminase large subunit